MHPDKISDNPLLGYLQSVSEKKLKIIFIAFITIILVRSGIAAYQENQNPQSLAGKYERISHKAIGKIDGCKEHSGWISDAYSSDDPAMVDNTVLSCTNSATRQQKLQALDNNLKPYRKDFEIAVDSLESTGQQDVFYIHITIQAHKPENL